MITLKLALLADYAIISNEGKLCIMGIFDRIHAAQSPITHPAMHLVVTFEADSRDAGKKHSVEFELIDADGHGLFKIGGELFFSPPPLGEVARFNHILNLNNLVFKDFGTYEFKVLVNQEVRGSVPLRLVEARPKSLTPPPEPGPEQTGSA